MSGLLGRNVDMLDVHKQPARQYYMWKMAPRKSIMMRGMRR